MSDLLRLITCGSVDDGKSTLIGRLLYESQAVFDDHLRALEKDSRVHGTQGGDLDLALLLDGLQAEREQGITIDVAYRHFSTSRRRFILADTPGHEQYTRNMVTGASTADAAIVLIDARKGLLPQTHRHSLIVSLLGVGRVVLAVNKMDLVDWSESVFTSIAEAYETMADSLGLDSVLCVPVSALTGDNVVSASSHMPWYAGSPLLPILEELIPRDMTTQSALRMPAQWINRPNLDFRGVSGTIAAGTVRVGQPVRVLPSGVESTVARITTQDGDLDVAQQGDAVTVVLATDVDVVRGDVICDRDQPVAVADQFHADIVWMHDEPMLPGRAYLLKIGTRTVTCTFNRPKHRIDPETLAHLSTPTLALNDIGACTLSTSRPIAFEPYETNRTMGGFIVIDRYTNATVGAGLIRFPLHRSTNITWQSVTVDKQARSRINGHKPAIVWLTGLSGTGKSTIGNIVEQLLHARGVRTYLLDGDNVRHGLTRDLGFTPADRVENLRRVGETAKLMVDAGLVVICTFISPYASERDMVRALVEPGEFYEVFVDTEMDELERRDPKGLYAKARSGEISNFTGIDAPYERPSDPDVRIDTATMTADQAAHTIVDLLVANGVID